MRILPLITLTIAIAMPMGLAAQEQHDDTSARDVLKAACERDARLTYRTGVRTLPEVREQMMAARKTYVRDCLAKASAAAS
ncbi:hypothetical protein [Microvirga terrestris]|uniref:Uncharacterized protein n=1 Tax=Microvirga terrestris TaxID=2791024 RepID=A0ABS0HW52_9HYPH|nr:hypothetical protein [Microvirga terrestris]MBF9197708.1 hypothetical protein [Microvirga terrestris]